MPRRHGREIANRFIRNGYMRLEYFEQAILDVEESFRRRYPDAEIIKVRNKHGVRVIVYAKKDNS